MDIQVHRRQHCVIAQCCLPPDAYIPTAMAMRDWCIETFGPEKDNGWFWATEEGRRFAKFVFKDEKDLVVFLLRFSGDQTS